MNKKQALKLLSQEYKGLNYIPPLCSSMPKELNAKWCDYWELINTRNTTFMGEYFGGYLMQDVGMDYFNDLKSLLRLIVAHHFIEDTYK